MFIDIFPAAFYDEFDKDTVEDKKKYKRKYRLLTFTKEPFEKIKSPKILAKTLVKLLLRIVLFPYTFSSREKVFKKLEYSKNQFINKCEKKAGKYIGYGPEVFYWDITLKFNIEKEEVFPLKTLKFEDAEFFVPNNYDGYLTKMYGDYMQLPPEEERIYHNSGLVPIKNNEKVHGNEGVFGDI